MFATVPIFNATALTSETGIIRPSLIRRILPHADVTVDGSATACCEAFYSETDSIIILVDINSMISNLQALTGTVDEYGSLI